MLKKRGSNFLNLFVLAFIFLILFPYPVLADINWAASNGSTAAASGSYTGEFGSVGGDPNKLRDGDASAIAYGANCAGVLGGCSINYTAIVNFPQAVSINRVELVHGADGGTCGGTSQLTDLLIGSNWVNIMGTTAWHTGGFITDSQTGSWNNVNGIRERVSGASFGGGGCSPFLASHYTAEIRAFGPQSVVDCGLRAFDGASTITIACEPLGTLTSPLRISKNGNIYGILLTDPSDPQASKLRVNTLSGVKSLRKL